MRDRRSSNSRPIGPVRVAIKPRRSVVEERSKALVVGGLVVTVALSAAWAVGRGDPAAPREGAAPMDALNATASTYSTVAWDLPVTRNDRVDTWIDFLKGRNAKLTERWLERSSTYTPAIRTELRKRGMPEDLIYLAFIESGYNPNAKSHAAAVGLWQFISDTGKRYGLEVSPYVDERRDPLKSTGAALDYLQELYDRFGSWYLAAAAYNTGENRVARIMREQTGRERGRDEDFWIIASLLPAETRNYVPLMLAAGHIGKEPAKYGFTDLDYHESFSFATVHVPAEVPLAAVAKATGVADSTIEALNPELVRAQTPPNRGWDVRVPVGTDAQFAANFPAALNDVRLVMAKARTEAKYAKYAGGATHKVKRGETLSGIAKRYGVTRSAIVKANGGILPADLQIGQVVRLPKGSMKGSSTRLVASKSSKASSSKASRFHRVRAGDNLGRIADRYDVSIVKLKRLNSLHSSTITPGQRLRVS